MGLSQACTSQAICQARPIIHTQRQIACEITDDSLVDTLGPACNPTHKAISQHTSNCRLSLPCERYVATRAFAPSPTALSFHPPPCSAGLRCSVAKIRPFVGCNHQAHHLSEKPYTNSITSNERLACLRVPLINLRSVRQACTAPFQRHNGHRGGHRRAGHKRRGPGRTLQTQQHKAFSQKRRGPG